MNDVQTFAQTTSTEQKPNTWLWPGLTGTAIGLVVGAAIASGIVWLVMREREQRLAAQLAERGIDLASDVWNTGITQAGNLLSGGSLGTKNETTPTKDEIAAYFEGKSLPLPQADNVALSGDKSSKSCIMKKDGIEALSKGSGSRWGSEPWSTGITFLYNAGDARYAVEADISHMPVGDKTAFFGFTVKRVAKQ
jgi:hypothetical protein